MQRSILVTCLDDELATLIHIQHTHRDIKTYDGYMTMHHFDRLHLLHVRLHKLTMLDPEEDGC